MYAMPKELLTTREVFALIKPTFTASELADLIESLVIK